MCRPQAASCSTCIPYIKPGETSIRSPRLLRPRIAIFSRFTEARLPGRITPSRVYLGLLTPRLIEMRDGAQIGDRSRGQCCSCAGVPNRSPGTTDAVGACQGTRTLCLGGGSPRADHVCFRLRAPRGSSGSSREGWSSASLTITPGNRLSFGTATRCCLLTRSSQKARRRHRKWRTARFEPHVYL